MRMIKGLFLGTLLLVAVASQAHAQTQDWQGRGYFHVSFGGQAQDQTFADTSTFTIYTEQAATAAGHSFGGGSLVDIAAGYRVWRNLAVGLGYSHNSNDSDAIVSVRVPHPILFGQSRQATETLGDLEHSESAVHLQFVWMMPLTNKIQFAVMAGPSFFSVHQDIVSPVGREDIRDVAPFTSVSIANLSAAEYKDSPVGVNIGVDGTYLITPMIGAGLFVRYAGASLDLPTPAGVTRDDELRAGGAQVGGGVRLRF